jgi:hypothetical protein
MIEYACVSQCRTKEVKRKGWLGTLPGQSEDGYGSKIVTDHQVLIDNVWYRVYATCYSNVASHWVIVRGRKLFLHDYDLSTN